MELWAYLLWCIILTGAFTPPTKVYQTFPQKAVVIIDGGYWESIRKKIGYPEIDLVKLSEDLCKPAYRLRTYYFDGKAEERQSIHDQLEMNERFEVVLGDVVPREIKCPLCNQKFVRNEQKRVDVQLATSLVHFATSKQADLIVLLAGDRDFLPVVEIAKSEMVILKLVYGSKKLAGVATGLQKAADERVKITEKYLQDYLSEGSEIIKAVKEPEEDILVFEDNKSKMICDVLAKTMWRKRMEKIRASTFGWILRKEKIFFEGKMKDFKHLTKNSIVVIGEGVDIYVTLNNALKKQLLPNFERNKDPAVSFMINVLKRLLKEEEIEMIHQSTLSNEMWKENSNWADEYEIDEPKAFSRLVNWAQEILTLEGKKGDWMIGIQNK